jgi:hypothetical protein
LPAGSSAWPFPTGRYQRNAREVSANAGLLRARADQVDACIGLIRKRRELLLELATLQDLPDEIAHRREMARLGRLHEHRLAQLQNELAETNAKIEVAAAQMRLAAALPIPVRDESPPAAPTQLTPAPAGFTADEVMAAVDELAEHMQDVPPEARRHLMLLLSGYLKEKRK